MKDSIKAGELRLNNWVMYDGWHPDNKVKGIEQAPYPVKVASIELDEIAEDYIIEGVDGFSRAYTANFEPIPLSKEVLERVKGCELISESTYKDIWDIEFVGVRHISLISYKVDKSWEVTFGNCAVLRAPHLHILQNVVYFNWGKELEITL